ncbi:MAG: CGNR zinc finger domain-containing protein [Actinomycetota bacterium]
MGQDGLVTSPGRIPISPFAEVVDGVVLPRPLSGNGVLDFCNTYAGWNGAASHDYLTAYDDLVVWSMANTFIGSDLAGRLRQRASRRRSAASAALEEATSFRADLYSVVRRPVRGPAWTRLTALVRDVNQATFLELDETEPRWSITVADPLRLPLMVLVRAAAALLASGDWRSVRACPGTGCGWLFLDPGGRRRWCTMAVCGNRAKARRFSERHRRR